MILHVHSLQYWQCLSSKPNHCSRKPTSLSVSHRLHFALEVIPAKHVENSSPSTKKHHCKLQCNLVFRSSHGEFGEQNHGHQWLINGYHPLPSGISPAFVIHDMAMGQHSFQKSRVRSFGVVQSWSFYMGTLKTDGFIIKNGLHTYFETPIYSSFIWWRIGSKLSRIFLDPAALIDFTGEDTADQPRSPARSGDPLRFPQRSGGTRCPSPRSSPTILGAAMPLVSLLCAHPRCPVPVKSR